MARIGVEHFELFDQDVVSIENVCPTTFTPSQVGVPKVEALAEQLKVYGAKVRVHKTMYGSQPVKTDVVIVGVDNMEARQQIWTQHKIDWKLWLDGRIGRDQASVFAVVKDGNLIPYLSSLQWETAPLPCGMKATAFICGGIVSGMMGTAVARWLNGLDVPAEMYFQGFTPETPFFSVSKLG